jgi:hypothetical protein
MTTKSKGRRESTEGLVLVLILMLPLSQRLRRSVWNAVTGDDLFPSNSLSLFFTELPPRHISCELLGCPYGPWEYGNGNWMAMNDDRWGWGRGWGRGWVIFLMLIVMDGWVVSPCSSEHRFLLLLTFFSLLLLLLLRALVIVVLAGLRMGCDGGGYGWVSQKLPSERSVHGIEEEQLLRDA